MRSAPHRLVPVDGPDPAAEDRLDRARGRDRRGVRHGDHAVDDAGDEARLDARPADALDA